MEEKVIQYISQDLYQEVTAQSFEEFLYNGENDSSFNDIKDVYSKLEDLKNSHGVLNSAIENLCTGVYSEKTEVCSELRNFSNLVSVHLNDIETTMNDMTEALKTVLEEQVVSDETLIDDLQKISELLGEDFDSSKYSSSSNGSVSGSVTTMPDGTTATTGTVEAQTAMAGPEPQEVKTVTPNPPTAANPDWSGSVLSKRMGVNQGPSGKETYYNLDMSRVVENMHNQGYQGDYWVRDDGVKMFGDYVIVAANLNVHPRGSIVQSSLGPAIVCDTGGFAEGNPNQIDIATSW